MFLEPGLQAAQDLDRFFEARLGHIDLLEAPGQRMILFEYAPVFGIGRGSNAAYLAIGEHRFDQVRGIHHPARCSACAYNCMNFIDKQDRTRIILYFLDDRFQALLEVTPILGAGNQGAHVERVDRCVAQHVRHPFLGDHPGKTFRQRRFANACVPHVQRIVLAAAAENLDSALDFDVTADQRIDFPLDGPLIQIGGVFFQRRRIRLALGVDGRVLVVARRIAWHLRHAMGNVVHDVQSRDVLHAQEVNGLRLFFAEDGHQHVRPGDLFLAA